MDKKTLEHIAELSRIRLTEEELNKYTPQMETILDTAKELKEVDTPNVQPMKAHVSFDSLREDIPGDTLTQEEVLKNAKYKELGCVKVYGKVFGAIEES